jgi:hypothetical protein
MPLNYGQRTSGFVATTANGEVDGRMPFRDRRQGDLVGAPCAGGRIRFGPLMARVNPRRRLEMRYQRLHSASERRTGRCTSTPEVRIDGRIRLHERWQWNSSDHAAGETNT